MSKWYSFKELKRARTPMLLDSETGLPDNHVITVVERVISVDDPELIQNNVRTDTFTLNLDAEYDDLNVVVIFTKPNNINVKVAYNGTPTHIPGSAMELVGSLACSVVGIDADGEVRAVTKAAPDTFQVVKSGAYDGSVTSDDVELLGQILQAVSDAEAAITEAETATTAATNATSQATSAATSANQAASSANSAASSANSAATKANSAAVDAQNAYDTLKPYMATIDSCANVLHREVGPDAFVTADDSFPCKPVEMVVYGNTVQNLWVNPNGTVSGLTATSNADGSITVSGTSAGIYSGPQVSDVFVLKPNTTYTLSTDEELSSTTYFFIGMFSPSAPDGQEFAYAGFINKKGQTFTTPSDMTSCRFGFNTNVAGTTVSGTYRVMLNEGSEAQPWCPPGLNSVGQLREDEKNLMTWADPFQSTGGITGSKNDDGTIHVEGTPATTNSVFIGNVDVVNGVTYSVSIEPALPNGFALMIAQGQSPVHSFTGSGGSVNAQGTVSGLNIVISSAQTGISIDGDYRIMINEGSTARPWVAPESESCVQVVTAGKNLLPPYNSDGARFGVTATSGTDGSVVVSGTSQNSSAFGLGNIDIPNWQLLCGKTVSISIERNNYLYCQLNYIDSGGNHVPLTSDSIGSSSVVPENDISNMYYFIGVRKGFSGTVTLHPQLEVGSSATEKEMKWANLTTTRIDLRGNTLNALPDGTRDELHIDGGGNVVLEKRTGTYIANGDEGWELSATSIAPYRMKVESWSEDVKNGLLQIDQFQADGLPKYAATRIASSLVVVNGRYQLYAARSGIQDASAFSEWLESNPMTVIYPLAEPQTIDLGTITPPTMAAPNVTAYVADDTPAEMELDYVRDINIVVDRLEKKVADLVVTEATIV